ncbi:beta-eliminating lyase-related protein [Streptomyces sp. NPDC101455]|uniref:beta-eliminating lyase-related protein n=1 Tax=Streptomyces sp. NPDC101455 TaxID=3366142 RepID=UPI0038039563
MSSTAAAVGAKIRLRRQQRGMSAAEMARRAGLSKATLSQLEAGNGNPTIDTLDAIAIALRIPIADLLARDADTGPVFRPGTDIEPGEVSRELLRRISSGNSLEIWRLRIPPETEPAGVPHATGTIEHLLIATGHVTAGPVDAPEFFTNGAKLVGVPGADSKIDPGALRAAVRRRTGDVHSVQPSAVSISQATESGSVYTLAEIRELSAIAKDAGLHVHMDGARFANALVQLGATAAEMTWKAGVEVLSFGATKNGAMTADTIVSFDPARAGELAFRAKRAGQLAAKMRFNTAQIDAYLTDDLWLRNARHANAMAARLGDGLKSIAEAGLLAIPQANIPFCRLPRKVTEGLLAEGYAFYHDRWEPGIVRFVTAFSHSADDIDQLLDAVRRHTH